MTKITIVLGSTRVGRMGPLVFNYYKKQAEKWEKQHNIQLEFVDLKDLNLPFFYEAQAPMANPNRILEGTQQQWLENLNSSDGFIFLTPEYNWGTSAVLRNALDYVSYQLQRKAVSIVSYAPHPGGGFNGGRDLAVLTGKLGAFVLPNSVALRTIQNIFTQEGDLLENQDATQTMLDDAMDEIVFYTQLYKNNPYSKK